MSDSKVPERLLTTAEAAEFLGFTEQVLRAWRANGRYKIPYIKIANRVRYRRSDLIAFVESLKIDG